MPRNQRLGSEDPPIAREIGDRQGEGGILGNLGLVYDSLGDYEQAEKYLEQTLTIAREIGDRQGEGNALGSLGNVYYSLGDYEQAEKYMRKSIAIFEVIKSPKAEVLRNNLKILLNLKNSATQL